jgi:hypothetical protein
VAALFQAAPDFVQQVGRLGARCPHHETPGCLSGRTPGFCSDSWHSAVKGAPWLTRLSPASPCSWLPCCAMRAACPTRCRRWRYAACRCRWAAVPPSAWLGDMWVLGRQAQGGACAGRLVV